MNQAAMQHLVDELELLLADASRGAEIARRLERYARDERDWDAFALFQDGAYARNLVHASELFELLVICWRPGQVSPIHDHQGQRCWMAVLDGSMRETHYHLPADGAGSLRKGRERVFQPGAVAYISDDIALHEIAPAGEGAGVTLHLYSRPIRECRIFEPESGRVTLRGLAYHSIGGVPQTDTAGRA